MTDLTIADLTTKAVDGTGAFDVLMQATQKHIAAEHSGGRITGNDYATVYLGSLQSAMDRALQFLLSRDKLNLELQILAVELEKAAIEKQRAENERDLVAKQIDKMTAEITLLGSENDKAIADKARIEAQTDLLAQQKANAVIEGTVLEAQECKLTAEFDLVVAQTAKVGSEEALLDQKKITEVAQTNATGVDENSVIGKQITLYTRQGDGFLRDAEQKATKLLLDTWNVRRTTDSGTIADSTNGLSDANLGLAVSKLLTGIGAT